MLTTDEDLILYYRNYSYQCLSSFKLREIYIRRTHFDFVYSRSRGCVHHFIPGEDSRIVRNDDEGLDEVKRKHEAALSLQVMLPIEDCSHVTLFMTNSPLFVTYLTMSGVPCDDQEYFIRCTFGLAFPIFIFLPPIQSSVN